MSEDNEKYAVACKHFLEENKRPGSKVNVKLFTFSDEDAITVTNPETKEEEGKLNKAVCCHSCFLEAEGMPPISAFVTIVDMDVVTTFAKD